MDEEAEREASAYVHRAMSFSGLGRRLTVVAAPADARADDSPPSDSRVVASKFAEPARTVPRPAIPVGLPEGATLAPMSGSREIVVPLPARVPMLVVTPTPPMARMDARDEPRVADPHPRRHRRNSFRIVFGLGVFVLEAALTRRHRRRSASRS